MYDCLFVIRLGFCIQHFIVWQSARVVSVQTPNIHDDWQLLLQAAGCKDRDTK